MDKDKLEIKISVRRLAEMLYRSGGLAGADYGSIPGVEGIAAHKKALRLLEENLRGEAVLKSEYSLKSEVDYADKHLSISGRADALLFLENEVQIMEIKSFRGPKHKLSSKGKAEHWAQAKIYAAMLAENPVYRQDKYKLSLLYISVDTEDFLVLQEEVERLELAKFLQKSAELYLSRVSNLICWQKQRNASILKAGFPYELLRAGQKSMMREVLACIRDTRTLFVEAPTGIGKTMATLYPALKALAASYVDRVFYATAMTSTRVQAEQALRDLRNNSAILLRSIRLAAKEKICLQPDLYCEQNLCPYAVGYYDRLPEAMTELLHYEELDASIMQTLGEKYRLCPFELSLDMAWYCDVIIGDYNHVFDPRISLKRFFDTEKTSPTAILVDEAHNLAARSRSMFSASLNLGDLYKLLKFWDDPNFLQFAGAYTNFRSALLQLISALEDSKKLFDYKDIQEAIISGLFKPEENLLLTYSEAKDWFLQDNFLGVKRKADKILELVKVLTREFQIFLDEQREFSQRRDFLLVFFDLLHFKRIGEEYFNASYITALKKHNDNIYLAFLCLDAAVFLSQTFYEKHPCVFFSATLYPLHFYENLIYAPSSSDPPESLQLPSPFPPENRLVLVDCSASLRYRDRAASLRRVRELILEAVSHKTANYLIFLPSYAYMRQLRSALSEVVLPSNYRLIYQSPGMSEKAKKAYLAEFVQSGQETLLAFAVLGGSFSEGIDLRGEALSGVICVGVGLPGLSPERQVLAEYSEQHFGSGFLYAYVFPAWQRIQQASGRLIRSEEDKGFILFIDQRWQQEPYRSLIPEDYNAIFLENKLDLKLTLDHFWKKLEPESEAPSAQ